MFVLGSARSGTSLMSSIVQSTSFYASYRAETKLLNSSVSKYGELSSPRSRKAFLGDWFRSRQFIRSGLSEEAVRDTTGELDSYIGFLGTYMNMIAKQQGATRWVDSTPSNANCLAEIATAFPKARVIHMVRDGRAVALSLAKLGWSGARTGNFDKALSYSALKWQSVIEAVNQSKGSLGDRFLEVQYESLVQNPEQVLKQVSEFLNIPNFDLNLLSGGHVEATESMKSTLRKPNSLFGDMSSGISPNAAYRWKSILDEKQIALLEENVGGSLQALGYELLATSRPPVLYGLLIVWRKSMIKAKRYMKRHTVLGKLGRSSLEIGLE